MFKRISIAAITAAMFAVVISSGLTNTSALAKVPGNNGTIKVHEQGTPSGTESNDPKVCVFNIEAFGLDAGQAGYISFAVQGGDKPTGTNAGPYAFGPANADGYFASQYFNLADGHYKVTLYGKDTKGNIDYNTQLKAKSKVFKVSCDHTPVTPAGPTTPVTPVSTKPDKPCKETPAQPSKPTTPAKPSTPVVTVASTTPATPTAPAPVKAATLPAELPHTGGTTALPALITLMAGVATYGVTLLFREIKFKNFLGRF